MFFIEVFNVTHSYWINLLYRVLPIVIRLLLALIFSLLLQSFASVAQQQTATGPHIRVSLLSESETLVPGSTHYLALHMQPDPQWHTYWRNPGDSGEAPSINWSSSTALTFGDIQWPIPEPIPVAHLVNYGYSDNHLLMVPVEVPDTVTPGESVQITADVSWLVCKEDCIPGWATLSTTMQVTAQSQPGKWTALFSHTRERLPSEYTGTASFEVTDSHITLALDDTNFSSAHVFPFRSDIASHSAKQQLVIDEDGGLNVLLKKSDYFASDPDSLRFLVSDGDKGIYVSANRISTVVEPSGTLSLFELAIYAGMAFLGGLILNIMPCVLPILSIKALSLQRNEQPSGHKWAYLMGVLTCFNVFAIAIIAMQMAGAQLGWGFHLQSPVIIAVLAFLFTFIGLALLDVFHIGSRFAGLGDSLVSGNSARGHFFTGTLAVIVASPCTAPFMAAALGVALTQSPIEALIIFNALALGFALPLTLMFLSTRARSWLPKPGSWMNTFKHALAFPMFATVAWLCWVFANQTNPLSQFLLLCGLIGFSFFCWGYSRLSASPVWKITSAIGMCACLLTVIPQGSNANIASENTPEQFSLDKLAALRAQNQVVLVNMTADWCITCKVNEQVALSTERVSDVLSDNNVHYLVGDWTNKNEQIFNYLKQYDRAGVPLYVVYAGKHYVKVLPQVLTPDVVVSNINNALKERSNGN